MRKISIILPVTAIAASSCLAISPAAVRINHTGGIELNADASVRDIETPGRISPQRAYGAPVTAFTADRAVFRSYGDEYANGSGSYRLYLANMEIKKGMPMAEGQMVRLELVGEPTDPDAPSLPVGTYSFYDNSDEYPTAGSFLGSYSDCLDVFVNPNDPESGELVAYQFTPTGGTVTVSKEGDIYTVNVNAPAELTDSEGNVIDTKDIEVSYTGEIAFEDHTAYTPLGNDYQMNLPNASGRVTDGGSWSIAFYNVPLDKDGFIVGAGELFNLEITTSNFSGKMNGDDLLGTYKPCDLMTEGSVPGCYGQGIWYNFYGMYVALGTNLTIYDDYANIDKVGLAESGEITITREGDMYTMTADLTTSKGEKLTGTYTGPLLDYITDMTSGVEGVSEEGVSVFGAKGHVICPENSQVYDITGKSVGADSLTPGIYIVRHNGDSTKVTVF